MEKQSVYPSVLLVLVVSTTLLCSATLAAAAKRGWNAHGQPGGTPFAGTVYVDGRSTGANDGSSWADAYVHLQDALADANTAEKPAEIRVAQGIYKPDRGADKTRGDRTATFQLINGVAIKGGYAGLGEPDPDARDIAQYQTILSGDLGGNDADVNDPADLEDEPTRVENSYNVVTGSGTDETAVLDGFSIAAGNYFAGAGMCNVLGSPTVVNWTFYGNTAHHGGGMYNLDSNPLVTDCNFVGNYGGGMYNDISSPKLINCLFHENVGGPSGGAISNTWYSGPALIGCTFIANSTGHIIMGRGGAISNDWWSNLTVSDCTFRANQASKDGGAIYNGMGDLTLSNCTFIQNSISPAGAPTAFAWGGAICNGSDARIVLTDCIFVENTAGSGGGMCNYPGGNLTLKGCSFLNNSGNSGGALDISHCYATLVGCSFSGNFATSSGGAIYSDLPKSLKVANCLFTGNKATQGGALYMDGARDTTVANCTFAANVAGTGSSLACGDWPSIFEFTNCILWDGRDPIWKYGDVSNGPGPPPAESNISVTYSNVQGGRPGEGNIDTDPCFADAGYWDPNGTPAYPNDDFWVNGDYHLKSRAGRWDPTSASWVRDDVTSSCIDAGHANSPIGFEPFPNGGSINMGAYGGTAEASKSYFGEPVCQTIIAGDINGDCRVDFTDFAIMARKWLRPTPAVFNVPPTVTILEPEDGAVFEISDPKTPIIIRADASDSDGSVTLVRFTITHSFDSRTRSIVLFDRDGSDGWQIEWCWADPKYSNSEGDFTVTAEATDDDGAVGVSPEIVITVHGPK